MKKGFARKFGKKSKMTANGNQRAIQGAAAAAVVGGAGLAGFYAWRANRKPAGFFNLGRKSSGFNLFSR